MTKVSVPPNSISQQHALPAAGSADTHNRRSILARLAAASMVAAAPGVAIAGEVDPHPAWYAEWKAAINFMDGPACRGVEEIASVPQYQRALDLEELIGTTPARTAAGARDQLRMLHHWCATTLPNDDMEAALENALATVERLAGGQAHG